MDGNRILCANTRRRKKMKVPKFSSKMHPKKLKTQNFIELFFSSTKMSFKKFLTQIVNFFLSFSQRTSKNHSHTHTKTSFIDRRVTQISTFFLFNVFKKSLQNKKKHWKSKKKSPVLVKKLSWRNYKATNAYQQKCDIWREFYIRLGI